MAGFSWISGTLALLLIAGNCVAAVDQNQLAQLVNEIWGKYKINRMFSLAASIPEKKNMNQQYDAKQVFSNENGEEVKMEIKRGNVFNKGRIVAATPLKKKDKTGKDTHAEYRVLQNFDTFINNNDDKAHDLLLFYVLGSPCYDQCTNESDELNILRFLDQIKKWKHYAFVFTYIFKSKTSNQSTQKQRREALEKIGIRLGLENIFRCEMSGDRMQCSSCSAKKQVADYCVLYPDEEPDSNQRQPPTIPNVPGNNANQAIASSSQRGLDNGNRNDVSTGGRDNGGDNGSSRCSGGGNRLLNCLRNCFRCIRRGRSLERNAANMK
ncbi:uncharacterized protein LOC110967728 [Acanthochromis polyacanthus]|uniref:uncharacterized protein LOC110967728 n=1 Tax=Acanthochromis polyacanthus TaxID=80966 RepID=UPI00223460B9|nr:uncharacterized protein LOC110967728 [Acanthochromis polyacanthus]